MVFDSHIHSKLSTDSKMEPEEAIAVAEKSGLGITFTEHYDADYGKNDYDFRVDSKSYLEDYAKFRNSRVLLGIEIGLTHVSIDLNKHIAESYPFDYVIGSVHMVRDIDIYVDFNFSEQPKITGEMYFDYVLEMIETNDFFDALGHIDYPMRYIKNESTEFSFKTNKNKYDAIFKSLIDRDIPIELNSRRIKDNYAELYEVYKRYRELGGKYVTLGSDSHLPDNIGQNFKLLLELVSEIGFTPVYFKERKKQEIK